MTTLFAVALAALSMGTPLDGEVVNLAGQIDYWEDLEGTATIDEIRSDAFRDRFQPSPKSVPNFGFKSTVFWFRVDVSNRMSIANWVVNIEYPVLDYVTFFVLTEGNDTTSKFEGGDRLPFSQRYRPHRTLNFPLSVAPNANARLWLRVQTEGTMQLPIKVYSEAFFGDMASQENMGYGLYYGFMAAVLLFAALAAVWLRERSYGFFLIYLLSFVAAQSLLNGLWFEWLTPNYPGLANQLLLIALSLLGAFGIVFMEAFLDLKNHHPKIYLVTQALLIWAIAMILSSFFLAYSFTVKLIVLFALLFVCAMFVSGIASLRRGYRPARYFLAAWVMFLLGTVVFSLKAIGFFPANFVAENAMPLGSLFQVLLLAVALGDKVLLIQVERDSATTAMLESYRQLDVELHRRVDLQTENDSLQQEMEFATDQLIQAEKLSSLGQMVAGVAHDIASPTNFIGNARKQVQDDVDEVSSMLHDLVGDAESDEARAVVDAFEERFGRQRQMLGNVNKGLERIKAINEAIRNYSRTDRKFQPDQPIRPLVDEAIIILHSKLQEFDVDVQLDALPAITCRRSQLGQVFANMLSNAADALGEKKAAEEGNGHFLGRINVRGDVVAREGVAGVLLRFEDSGTGIPEDVRAQILQPFYTTKEVGKGTGLGMSICDRIIKKHNGELSIGSSRRLGGASMEIWLPIEQDLESSEGVSA